MKIEIPDELIEAFVEEQANKCAAANKDYMYMERIHKELWNGGLTDDLCLALSGMISKKIPEMKASQEEAWEESKREQRKQADNLSQF